MELIKEGRKLVTIRKINDIKPIDGADLIELAIVDGWTVVIKKEEFNIGDYCVFFEIDSFLPANDSRFSFLAKNGTKTDEAGVERIRLRSVKLRKQLSQGLVLPVTLFSTELWEIHGNAVVWNGELNLSPDDIIEYINSTIMVLEDSRYGIEEYLNVTKYERPDDRQNGGANRAKTAGNFPIFIPKTDEDRVQNIFGKFSQTMKDVPFRKSLKLDGSSETIAFVSNPDFFIEKIDDVVQEWNEETQTLEVKEVIPYPFTWEEGQGIVCSRNLALKYDVSTAFWKAVLKDDIIERLRHYCNEHNRQFALQGECMGPGIQGNRENLEEHTFFCFRIWDIDSQCFLDDSEFIEVTNILGVNVVPQGDIVYFFNVYNNIAEALASADHISMIHPIAEGDVYKSIIKVNDETIHFKVINNKYLLKCED